MSASPPPEIGWMIEAIGAARTFALVQRFGGVRVRIPATETGCIGSPLAYYIGVNGVRALSRTRPNEVVKVPAVRAWRAQILLARGKLSQSEIALRVGLTEDRVQKIAGPAYVPVAHQRPRTRRRPRATSPQLRLEI